MDMKGFDKIDLRRSGVSLAAMAVMMAVPGFAHAQASDAAAPAAAAAQDNAATQDDASTEGDIVVTGFRGSLAKALNMKKSESGSTDSILAEDIGKFPDLNLSESIQRIPGVALLRDGGEGRSISVRGLGPQFTRVRINGLEAIATAGGSDPSGGTNRGRGFDFNVFASDLFNAITVRKTAQAETEEGSLGATVDLQTAHPFDYKEGLTFVASAQASYNDLAEKTSPRAAALISGNFADGTIGVLLSGAYSKRKIIETGYSTVRWAPNTVPANAVTSPGSAIFSPGFESVLGTNCQNAAAAANDATNAKNLTGVAVCDAANQAFHPRFPRYDYFADNEERIGATASLQWKPSDDTLISLDGLYADFKATREERYLEAVGFSVTGACTAQSRPTNCGVADIDVTAEHITNGVMDSGTFNDVDLRVENRFDKLDTKFKQLTLTAQQKFGDSVTVDLLAGHSSSDHSNPIQNTITFDQYNVDGYSYDYSQGRIPTFNFGNAKLTDPTAWVLSQIRLRAATAKNTYDTGQLAVNWKVAEGFDLKLGAEYKKYKFSTTYLQRSNGTTAAQDTNVSCCSADARSNYSQVVQLGPTQVLIPSYFDAEKYFDLTNPTARGGAFKLGPEPGLSSNNAVSETDKAAFLQVNFSLPVAGMTLRGDAGTRYVQTHQVANGYALVGSPAALTPVVVERTYEDFLPAMNVVLDMTPNLLLRGAVAKVMARPDLGSLAPGVAVAVSGANKTVTAGNPDLDPYRATTFDLSLEWYYQPGALISVALFQKNINSFVQTINSSGTFSSNPFGLPDSAAIAACGTAYPATCGPASNWTYSQPRNGPGGTLKGFEVNFQQPLKFLPGFLRNTGVLLNYTYVSSSISYLNSSGAIVAVNDLTGLSRHAGNATLYYEDKVISARVSAAYRSKYLTRVPGQQGTDIEGTNSTLNIDASLQFTINEHFKLTLEGVNLTDEFQDQYVDTRDMLSVYHHTGREFLAGIRYSY
jgi:iron complex outermembrane receptor protein